jgi:hypothetical protein
MKVNEVPQDGKRMMKTTLIQYAVNNEGSFETISSNGWNPGYYAGFNLQKEFKELASQAKERVQNNQSSPLEYFMFSATLDLDGLALFLEIPKRKVKKHLTVKGFEKLSDDILEKYALVLHTDVESIKKFKSTLK